MRTIRPARYSFRITTKRQFLNGREYLYLIDHDRGVVRVWDGVPHALRPAVIGDALDRLHASPYLSRPAATEDHP